MPIFDTGMIPLNGNVDDRDPLYSPLNSVEFVKNAVVTPEGIYRRPPWIHKKALYDDVVEHLGGPDEYIDLANVRLKSMPLVINNKAADYLCIYFRYSSETVDGIAVFIYDIDTYNLVRYYKDRSSFSFYDEFEVYQIDSDQILIVPEEEINSSIGQPNAMDDNVLLEFLSAQVIPGETYSVTLHYGWVGDIVQDAVGSYTAIDGDTPKDVLNGIVDNIEQTTSVPLRETKGDLMLYIGTGGKVILSGESSDNIAVYVGKVPSLNKLPASGVNNVWAIGPIGTNSYYVEYDGSTYIETTINKRYIKDTSGKIAVEEINTKFEVGGGKAWLVCNMGASYDTTTVEFPERYVGDSKTAPMPSFVSTDTFVGKDIKDIVFLQGRLGVLTESTLVLSRANDEFNFFPETATKILPTDPIDIEVGDNLKYAVPYNGGLIIFGESQQYFVSGANGLISPTTISVTPTTSYSVANIKPKSTGDTILFVSKGNDVYEFYSRYEVAQTSGNKLTEFFNPFMWDVEDHGKDDPQITYPKSQISFSDDAKWGTIPAGAKTVIMRLGVSGESTFRLFGSIDDYRSADNITFIGQKAFSFREYPKPALYEMDFSKLRVSLKFNVDEPYLDYGAKYDNIGLTFSRTYDQLNNKTIIDFGNSTTNNYYNAAFDQSDGSYHVGEFETPTTRSFDGDVLKDLSTVIFGNTYDTLIQLKQYIPRDNNQMPLHFKRVTYKLGEIYYQGGDFNVHYGAGEIGNLPYTISTPEAYLNESSYNTTSIDSSTLRIPLRGYRNHKILLESESIHPLLIKGIRYEITYFRGR